MGHFLGSPRFLAISHLCHFAIISTLNFGPSSTKLGGTVRAIKILTHKDNRLGPSRKYGETATFTFGGKVFLWPKIHVFPKKQTPKLCLKTDIYFGKGYFFVCTTFPCRGQNLVRVKKCSFFGPEILFFGPKI